MYAFAPHACVYAQTDRDGCVVRVGKATKGLARRYYGGTGHALDAAMHASGNLFYVAVVPTELCENVEATLIWTWRDALPYNIEGKRRHPARIVSLQHQGDAPRVLGVVRAVDAEAS